MKIASNIKKSTIPLKKLKYGDVFEYGGEFFMKAENGDGVENAGDGYCYTVHLQEGDVNLWLDNHLVYPVTGSFVPE